MNWKKTSEELPPYDTAVLGAWKDGELAVVQLYKLGGSNPDIWQSRTWEHITDYWRNAPDMWCEIILPDEKAFA